MAGHNKTLILTTDEIKDLLVLWIAAHENVAYSRVLSNNISFANFPIGADDSRLFALTNTPIQTRSGKKKQFSFSAEDICDIASEMGGIERGRLSLNIDPWYGTKDNIRGFTLKELIIS